MMTKNIVFIGNDFYHKSKTIMSSVYEHKEDKSYERTDWGFIKIWLEMGICVNICPATSEELKMFNEILKEISVNKKGDNE